MNDSKGETKSDKEQTRQQAHESDYLNKIRAFQKNISALEHEHNITAIIISHQEEIK